MKKIICLLIAAIMIGCNAEDSSTSNDVEETRNDTLTGNWNYTYTITTPRTDTFELNAAGGVMTGYFTNTHFGDFITLYGDYDETTMGFISSNFDNDRKYVIETTYTNNSMTGTMVISTIAGVELHNVEITAVKQ